MKKLILLGLVVFVIGGCSYFQSQSLKDLLNQQKKDLIAAVQADVKNLEGVVKADLSADAIAFICTNRANWMQQALKLSAADQQAIAASLAGLCGS